MKARNALAGMTALLAAGSQGLGAIGAPIPMRQRIINVTNAVARGQIVGPRSDIEIIRFPIYHRVDVSGTDSEIELFGATPSHGVTNMPAGANGLPNNYGFVCTHIGAQFTYGYAVDGTAVAAVEGYNTSTVPLEVANDLRHLYDNGLFRLYFSDKEVAQVYGVGRLAMGGGAFVQANAYGTGAAISFANVRNGVPHDDTGYELRPWQILRESQSVRATLKYNFDRTLKGAYVLHVVLDGLLIRPR